MESNLVAPLAAAESAPATRVITDYVESAATWHLCVAIGHVRPPELAKLRALSSRELQVSVLVSHGHTNRQIARLLSLSEKTVETHLARIFAKLAVASRAAVASTAGPRQSPLCGLLSWCDVRVLAFGEGGW